MALRDFEKKEFLISQLGELEEVEQKRNSCSCCFCCNCCKENKEYSKTYYINKWRKYLLNENDNISRPFIILTNLWAHKNVVKELEQTRLNPNLISKNKIRNDLEFYIPQMCTFLIFGEYEAVEEFLAFLCKACFASFFFAHRIIWFLRSIQLQDNLAMNDKIEYILQLIHTIFKSEKEKDKIERFHLPSSKRYMDFIKKFDLYFLYNNNETNEENFNEEQNRILSVVKTTDNLIKSFCENILSYAEEVEILKNSEKYKFEEAKIKPFVWEFKVNPEEVLIKLFNKVKEKQKMDPDNLLNRLNGSKIENENQLKNDNDITNIIEKFENDVNLNSFMSTLKFIEELCNISERMKDIEPNDQMGFLRREITEINKNLPANVYIPFLKDSLRNYLVCHMPITELKIFRTKNRAPFMITIEVIRIDEIISSLTGKNKKNTSYDYITKDYTPPSETSLRIRSYSMVESVKDISTGKPQLINRTDLSYDYTIKKKELKHAKTFIDPISGRNRSNTMQLVAESDVNLSKPVTISNLESENKKKPLSGHNKIIVEENEDEEEFFVKEGVQEFVKRRLSAYHINSNHKLSDNFETNNQKDNKFRMKNKLEEEPQAFKENNDNLNNNYDNDELIKFKQRPRNYTTSEVLVKESNLLNLEDKKSNMNFKMSMGGVEKDECKEINYDNTLEIKKFNNVFGESAEEQSARIRLSSPFGDFNSWRTFKMIIKSGEDLRQEQFATQLINEFHQIFMIEKVKCWVNPYEIISTGNNVGIIECVPNAISVDQLKRKIGITSIRSFYETHFGPIKSKSFEKAIKNFIKSLAGYSLVCYFLQIKDRHNANILIDDKGHIIHIDFGFLLSNSPGKGIKFEDVPFKLTSEFVDVMGGVNSKYFNAFRKLLWKGFIAITKHSEKILILVEMMYCGHGKHLPCFENKFNTIEALKARFSPRHKMTKVDYMKHVDSLIEQSIDNWRTRWYDKFQYHFQGIFY